MENPLAGWRMKTSVSTCTTIVEFPFRLSSGGSNLSHVINTNAEEPAISSSRQNHADAPNRAAELRADAFETQERELLAAFGDATSGAVEAGLKSITIQLTPTVMIPGDVSSGWSTIPKRLSVTKVRKLLPYW
jgi:hypothetical protein